MGKLMIVDDSSTMRKIIMRTLRQAGVNVEFTLEASNGVEALSHLKEDQQISLILSDVNMPDMDGIDMIRKAREVRSAEQLRIIMISAEGSEARQREAISLGADGYVTKPFTAEAILAAIGPFLD